MRFHGFFEEWTMQTLIVVRPFGLFRPGDAISEPDEVALILASEHTGHVVRCTSIGGAAPENEGAHVQSQEK